MTTFVQMNVGSYALPISHINTEVHILISCCGHLVTIEEANLGMNPMYREGKAQRIEKKQI